MAEGINFFVTAGADGKIDGDEFISWTATGDCIQAAVAHHSGALASAVFRWTVDEADLARIYLED